METIDIQRSFTRTDVRVIAVGSFVLGAAGGVLVTRHVLTKKYLAIVNFEVEAAEERYAKKYKEGAYSTPEGAAAVLIQEEEYTLGNFETLPDVEDGIVVNGESHPILVDDGGQAIAETGIRSQRVEPVQTNAFSDANFRLRQDEAMEIGTVRTPDLPYEISVDEFFTENPHFEKLTVRYWEGDDTLADDRESPVPDTAVDEVIGGDNLDKFGLRSGDPNIVYVRNEKISVDYEVIRDRRKYAVIVAGANPDDLEDDGRNPRVKRRSDVERDN